MTQKQEIKDLKAIAKKIARAKRIEHHEALALVATELGFPHWYAVSSAGKNGWCPKPEEVVKATELLGRISPSTITDRNASQGDGETFGDPGGGSHGEIDGHAYEIEVSMDDVYMTGRGWVLHVPEAPSADPTFAVTDKRYKANPINDPEFVTQALEIANSKAEQVRARIASDWPRRSTKPDDQGRAVHPLRGELSNEWFCLHCDSRLSAREVARNLWHCPSCSASPLDIFSSPWWLGESPDETGSPL